MKQKTNHLLFAALVGGGLYWASRQPGGIKGTWSRFNAKLTEIQNSNDPLGTIKQQFQEARNRRMTQINPVSGDTLDTAAAI